MRKASVLAAIVLSTFIGATACNDNDPNGVDDDEDFVALLTTANEIPAPTGSSTATANADLELEDRVLTVRIVVTGNLTSGVTMAHIHGPATSTTTGNIMLDFVPAMTSAINAGLRTGTILTATYDLDALPVSATGVLRVDANTLIETMNSGQAYVNVHTVLNPAGELRGTIVHD
ncbi:MAG TPA: CHRD domain-containing protein [Gemmatimonadaceae bacterium]|nr:CHRD domain-containing protein [Gemmatimonadaceae bacterium]